MRGAELDVEEPPPLAQPDSATQTKTKASNARILFMPSSLPKQARRSHVCFRGVSRFRK